MITDVLRAIGQLGDPRFRRVLGYGVGLSVALLAAFSALFIWLLQLWLGPAPSLPWIGPVTWLDDVTFWASIPLMVLLSVFLMVPVASAFTGLFLDRIAAAVEDVHYPGLPAARSQSLAENLRESAGFLGLVVAVNLVASVVYLLFIPIAPLLFWAVNGFLLGREYAQMSAARHLPPPEARAFRKRHSLQIFATGVVMAIPLSIPVVNLLVPVLGAATFTHLFHRLRARG